MSAWQLETPVVLLIFNRPDTTERVFAEIAKAKPSQLLVVADGPRPDHPGEGEKCAASRRVIERVDWDCKVLKNYSETNMGCRRRVSSGLDWVFEQVDEAIILEDDCVPDQSFFYFCQEMLERYRPFSQVMQISGYNLLGNQYSSPYSYYFSSVGFVWGWATWRRAWQLYDVDMHLWPLIQRDGLSRFYPFTEYRCKSFERTYDGSIDTWDYQWGFCIAAHAGLCIIPANNLVRNIGFRSDATHTTNPDSARGEIIVKPLSFPLQRVPYILADREYDQALLQKITSENKLFTRAKRKITIAVRTSLKRMNWTRQD